MNAFATANEPPVLELGRAGVGEAWIPGEGHSDAAPVGEIDGQGISRQVNGLSESCPTLNR